MTQAAERGARPLANPELSEVFRKCLDIFSARVHPAGHYSRMCELHSILGADCRTNHNCLGCNFNESTGAILDYLMLYDRFTYEGEACQFYLMRLYLLVERINIIFEILKLPDEIKGRRYSVFQDVHKWANFIKHPGPFFFVHHARYYYAGMAGFKDDNYDVIIDQEFVKQHYSSQRMDKKLWDLLTNKRRVAVLFPDPVSLTIRFCDAIDEFLRMLRENSIQRELLAKRSTYEAYFASESQDAESRPVHS